MPDETCANCHFSIPEHPAENFVAAKASGEMDEGSPGPLFCRRYAPRPLVMHDEDAATEWTWPIVFEENWCGEWSGKNV